MSEYVTIFIHFCVIQKVYECRVTRHCTFYEIIHLLKEMISDDLSQFYQIDEQFVISEKFTHDNCPKDITMDDLHVQNGMWFDMY